MLARGKALTSSAVSDHVICVLSSSSSSGAFVPVGSGYCRSLREGSFWGFVFDLEGVVGPALWDQRSTRFRLPVVEEGVGGR